MQNSACFFLVTLGAALICACAPSQPKPAPPSDATNAAPVKEAKEDAAAAAPPSSSSSSPSSITAAATATASPTASTSASTSTSTSPPVKTKVKIVTIGMHVAGGPFDEPTKEPFKKAVEPHFPEIAQCWGKHIATAAKPPKQADVGVDLLIEASGGHPKISNPRLTPQVPDAPDFMPCVIAVFESVEFAKLVDRGRTGVSYSLRFTSKD